MHLNFLIYSTIAIYLAIKLWLSLTLAVEASIQKKTIRLAGKCTHKTAEFNILCHVQSFLGICELDWEWTYFNLNYCSTRWLNTQVWHFSSSFISFATEHGTCHDKWFVFRTHSASCTWSLNFWNLKKDVQDMTDARVRGMLFLSKFEAYMYIRGHNEVYIEVK
jgi:hypothetical protein